jgi:hypothetical protein
MLEAEVKIEAWRRKSDACTRSFDTASTVCLQEQEDSQQSAADASYTMAVPARLVSPCAKLDL